MRKPITRGERIVWALRKKDGSGLLFAAGCYLAPWTFRTRDQAKAEARRCAEHGLDVTAVKIRLGIYYFEETRLMRKVADAR